MPLQSVIIPTFKRPKFLKRAIGSALNTSLRGDIEVLVVPNGPDDTWHEVAESFADDKRVKWLPIESAQVSAARNFGLQRSVGKFVRFLDDDDYLQHSAAFQCQLLSQSVHDVSQGAILRIDSRGNVEQLYEPIESDDFIESTLGGQIFTLCHSFLWRRSRIDSFRWNVGLEANEDVAWALGIEAEGDLSMHHFNCPVGYWVNHTDSSISRKTSQSKHDITKAFILLDVASKLERRGVLTPIRRTLIGRHLWNCIHTSFPSAPIYWTRVATKVMGISPGSRPDDETLGRFPFSVIHPLAIEILMTPHRFVRHRIRMKSM